MIAISAILGALAVVCGAFGAHALRSMLSAEMLAIWNTGAHYQLVHAVALTALALAHVAGVSGLLRPWRLLLAGTAIFSLSLYVLAITGIRTLGAVTPVGGVLLVLGWLDLAFSKWSASRAPSDP